jgi:hypothetical protein
LHPTTPHTPRHEKISRGFAHTPRGATKTPPGAAAGTPKHIAALSKHHPALWPTLSKHHMLRGLRYRSLLLRARPAHQNNTWRYQNPHLRARLTHQITTWRYPNTHLAPSRTYLCARPEHRNTTWRYRRRSNHPSSRPRTALTAIGGGDLPFPAQFRPAFGLTNRGEGV